METKGWRWRAANGIFGVVRRSTRGFPPVLPHPVPARLLGARPPRGGRPLPELSPDRSLYDGFTVLGESIAGVVGVISRQVTRNISAPFRSGLS